MSLEENEPRWADAFEYIFCPVCASEKWNHLPMQGIFCDECNCKASLRPTMGDGGFVVDFDADFCWSSIDDEKRIPSDSTRGRAAYSKFLETDGGYSRCGICVYAFFSHEADSDDWEPAYNREQVSA